MIDLQKKREENKARLLGQTVDEGKVVVPYTKEDVIANPETCWDIISLVTRKKVVENEGKDGKVRRIQTKELAHPELLDEVVVGGRKTTTKGAKRKVVTRSNIKTMDEMYGIRNKMNGYAINDNDDEYVEYFTSVVEVLDGYAQQVLTDILDEDEDFLNRVNKARGC